MLRRDRWIASALVTATLLVAWGVTAIAGLIDVPRTDDWGFAREAFSLHDGHLRLINWGPMTKIGVLLWAQPFLWLFGDHHWALAVSTSVLVAAGLVAAYALARLRLGAPAAAGAVLVLLLFPGVVRDTASFMTDPAALAFQLITLALGAFALRAGGEPRFWLFVAALSSGLWAFSVRELAVAAPLAVIIAAVTLDAGRAWRRRAAIAGSTFTLLAGAIWLWHSRLDGVETYRGHAQFSQFLQLVVSCAITVSLALAPALALSLPRWWHVRHRVGRICGALAGAGVVAARPLLARHLGAHNWWLVGDYLQPDGINGEKMLIGYRPTVLNGAIWHVLIGAACVSTVICGALLGEWLMARTSSERRATGRSADPVARLVGWHVTLASLVLVVAAVWNGVLFDRYTWPLIFSGGLLVMSRTASAVVQPTTRLLASTQIVATATFVVALGTAALLTVNSAAFDRARWRAAEQAVAGGSHADEVDGGIEWDGMHSKEVNRDGTPTIVDPLIAWWTHMTAMPRVCVVITASPVDSSLGQQAGTFHWRTWLFAGDADLHLYRVRAPGCP